MFRSLKNLERYVVSATDGDVGTVVNFLLDDERWVVRYLVVETGTFFDERRILISPISFRRAEWSTHRFEMALTIDQVKNSPSIDTDKPVSRQHERDYHAYYGYPYYWGYPGLWAMERYPSLLAAAQRNDVPVKDSDKSGDVHLRSAKEVRGYHIEGSDGAIGHVDDFIADDETWEVRYLVVDTSNWWFGKKVLLSPHWANGVSWDERRVFIDLSRLAVKSGPEWNVDDAVNREYEVRLYDYYGRPIYWDSGAHPEGMPPIEHPGNRPE
jgi:hypothetical protein